MIQEFYVRKKEETDARGPYARAELEGLIAKGEVNATTLYYDAEVEEWRVFGKDPELRKLLGSPKANRALLQWLAGLFLLIVGVAVLLPWILSPWTESSEKFRQLLADPFLLSGAVFVCAMFPMGLFKGSAVWVLRILLALGLGVMGTFLWLQGQTGAFVALAVGSVALLIATWVLKSRGMMISLLSIGLIGALVFLALRIT